MYQLLREHPMAVDVEERMSWRGRLHLEHALDDKAIRRAEEKSILRATTRDLLPDLISERAKSPYPSTQSPAYEQALRDALAAIQADRNAPVAPLDSSRIQQTLAKPLGSVSPMYERLAVDLAERVRRQPRTLVLNRMWPRCGATFIRCTTHAFLQRKRVRACIHPTNHPSTS